MSVAVSMLALTLLVSCTSGAASQAAQPSSTATATVSAPVPINSGLLDQLGEPITDERMRLFAQWQSNEAFENNVRYSVALVDIFFRPDGSQIGDDSIKAQVREQFVDDPYVLATLNAVEADFARGSTDTGLFASELAIRLFPRESSPGRSLQDMPSTEELAALVMAGNERLDPLRDGYLATARNAIAAGSGRWLFGLGVNGMDLITEYVDPAKALPAGPALQGAIADLEASIPEDARPGNDIEVRHAFARFAIALTNLMGEPALAAS